MYRSSFSGAAAELPSLSSEQLPLLTGDLLLSDLDPFPSDQDQSHVGPSVMTYRDDSPGDSPDKHVADLKLFAEDVIPVTSVLRNKDRTTFDNESLESFYKPTADYEGLHRYDPEFSWEPQEERKLVRKVSGFAMAPSLGSLDDYRSHLRRSTTKSAPGSASCSLLSNSTEATSLKPCRTTCWTICT